MTLDQIITDEDFPECRRLANVCEACDLDTVAEVKGEGHSVFFMGCEITNVSLVETYLHRRSVQTLGSKVRIDQDCVCLGSLNLL